MRNQSLSMFLLFSSFILPVTLASAQNGTAKDNSACVCKNGTATFAAGDSQQMRMDYRIG